MLDRGLARANSYGVSNAIAKSVAMSPSLGGIAYEQEATDLFARFTTQPDATRKGHINTLILALKNGSVWAKIDRLYICAAHENASARLNWKSTSYNLVDGTTPATFAVDQGYTFDGTANTLMAGGALAAPITQNNLALGVWCRLNILANTAVMGGGAVELRPRAGAGLMSARTCDAATNSAADVASSIGWSMATIDPANTANKVYYKGTAVEMASTARATIVALPATTQTLGGVTASTFCTNQIAAAVWAQNLTAQNNTDLCNAISAYMTAVGA